VAIRPAVFLRMYFFKRDKINLGLVSREKKGGLHWRTK